MMIIVAGSEVENSHDTASLLSIESNKIRLPEKRVGSRKNVEYGEHL